MARISNPMEPLGTCNTTSVAMVMKYYDIIA
jgi:hypothetical protein